MTCRGDSPAARQRRRRARQKRGLVCVRLEIEHDEVVEALIRSGRLTEDAALRLPLVERALAAVLAEWARRWLEIAAPHRLIANRSDLNDLPLAP